MDWLCRNLKGLASAGLEVVGDGVVQREGEQPENPVAVGWMVLLSGWVGNADHRRHMYPQLASGACKPDGLQMLPRALIRCSARVLMTSSGRSACGSSCRCLSKHAKALPNTDRREHLASKTVPITYDGRGGSAYRANCSHGGGLTHFFLPPVHPKKD